MEKPYSFYNSLLIFFFLCLLYQPSTCQQTYINNTQLDCNENPSISRGYLCNGPQTSCQSFVSFRSMPPYNSPMNIAYLLGSEASTIALLNNISSENHTIPSEKSIIVPVSCSCSGSIYQHNTPYTIKNGDTYFLISNNTYQGLTTCQALIGQNYYGEFDLVVGSELMIPLRCACPSKNQTINGVSSLLAYMVTLGDNIPLIANEFGVSKDDILEANMLSQDDSIFPFTPLLIPLKNERCITNPENFFCYCSPEGLNCKIDGKKFPVKLVVLLGLGLGIGFLLLVLLGYYLYILMKKRRNRIRKRMLFNQNGGILLQERLLAYENGSERTKIFTAEELERATDNYNQSRFLGQGGYGTVYKGMLPDGSIVAVKRSKAIDKNQIDQFINEVVILSQINHRNIVKLLGFCLEIEVPVLVYEFITNGTLSHHIHHRQQQQQEQEEEFFSLSWEYRVRIACEVAGAIAYMHSSASIPIFHRDIKSSNILLDENYIAKVSDFGTSRSLPNDKTHLTTAVQGTFGYMDPEYFQSSQFTEKSDVYSFGVVLVELLTGEKPISFSRAEEMRNLVAHFILSAKDNKLVEILDSRVAKEARKEDIDAIAYIAMKCLRLNGKKRPTMKEVAIELEGLRGSQKCIEIYKELPQKLLRDEISCMHNNTGQESVENSIEFSQLMTSTSF